VQGIERYQLTWKYAVITRSSRLAQSDLSRNSSLVSECLPLVPIFPRLCGMSPILRNIYHFAYNL
jgi:hypothetical protein